MALKSYLAYHPFYTDTLNLKLHIKISVINRNNEESNDNEASVAGKADREESAGKEDKLDANGKCE